MKRVSYFLSDLAHWVRTHLGRTALIVAALAVAVLAALLAAGEIGGEEEVTAPAPEVIVRTERAPEEPEELGFPAFATRNTTRVAGATPADDAAGVALASFPSTGPAEGPGAVVLADEGDWPSALVASVLVAEPVGAPLLLADDGDLGELTEQALERLDPSGSPATDNRELFAIGTDAPGGYRAQAVAGANPAEVAAGVARLRERLAGKPDHVVIASSDSPEHAMPAAAWAARSGDPILFTQRNSVPGPTLEILRELEDVPVYLLGGPDVISPKAQEQIEKAAGEVARAAEDENPVAAAVEFARYVDGTFGWNINDPGHGFVIANVSRPADAGAAAALSAGGTWGPLLVTDDAGAPPPELQGYLLDLKPGYVDDPTRAVYNHVWIVGDEASISVDFQAAVDQIAEVAPVRGGTGDALLGPAPGTPEDEGDEPRQSGGGDGGGSRSGGSNGGGGQDR